MTKDYIKRAMFPDQTAWDNNNSIKNLIYRKPKFRKKLNVMFRRKARRNYKMGIDRLTEV